MTFRIYSNLGICVSIFKLSIMWFYQIKNSILQLLFYSLTQKYCVCAQEKGNGVGAEYNSPVITDWLVLRGPWSLQEVTAAFFWLEIFNRFRELMISCPLRMVFSCPDFKIMASSAGYLMSKWFLWHSRRYPGSLALHLDWKPRSLKPDCRGSHQVHHLPAG